jgi:hypothetical protein
MQHTARLSGRGQHRHGPAAPRRSPRASVLLLLLGGLLAGCTAAGDDAAAPGTTGPPDLHLAVEVPDGTAPPTLPLPPGYERPDTRGVTLSPAVGRPGGGRGGPAPEVAMSGGTARLHGQLTGPDGPVGGATVRIERFVDDRVGRLDVASAGNGTFEAAGLPGGRYRVRAWLRPSLTVTHPVVVFLGADQGDETVDLALERRVNSAMSGTAGVRAWQVGQGTGVAVLVTQEYVDNDGIARSGGVPGVAIDLAAGGPVQITSAAQVVTGNDGYARFTVECVAPGQPGLTATSNGYSRQIPLPYCAAPPPPPTAPPSTTADVTFTTPAAGPFPAGTYQAQGDNAPARCAVTYEIQAGDSWRPGQSAGWVVQSATPIRNVQVALGLGPCPYKKVA